MTIKLPDNATNKDLLKLLYGEPDKEMNDSVLYKFKWGKTNREYFWTHFSKEWLDLPLNVKENDKSREVIDVKELIQRINLNYNDHQMISVSALKDIINTEPKYYFFEDEKEKREVTDMSNIYKAYNRIDEMLKTGRYSNGCKIPLEILEDLKIAKDSLKKDMEEEKIYDDVEGELLK